MPNDLGPDKQRLHQLIEELPPEQIPAALRYMNYLSTDPMLVSLLNATPDDELTQKSKSEEMPKPKHLSLAARDTLMKKYFMSLDGEAAIRLGFERSRRA